MKKYHTGFQEEDQIKIVAVVYTWLKKWRKINKEAGQKKAVKRLRRV